MTLIEFAFVLPLLLGLVFATIDFGLFFFVQHTVQFATREGVRLALVGRTINDASGNALSREASIITTIRNQAAMAVNPNTLQISIYPVNPDYTDPVGWQNTQNAGGPGSYMRVRSRCYYKFVTPVLGVFLPDGKLLVQAEATYRNELFN